MYEQIPYEDDEYIYDERNGCYVKRQLSPPPPSSTSGSCIASMTLGIVAVIMLMFSPFIMIPCAILGIVFSLVGIRSGKGGRGMGIAGLVLSIISLVPVVLIFLAVILGVNNGG